MKYGNLAGKHFTQWRVDTLNELVQLLTENYRLVLDNAKIWYDADNDYHMLEFSINGVSFEVRFYKVFGLSINGERSDRTFMERYIYNLAAYIKEVSEHVD